MASLETSVQHSRHLCPLYFWTTWKKSPHSRMMDGVIKLERGQNESSGIYFWESCLRSVTHRQFKISSRGHVFAICDWSLMIFIAKGVLRQLLYLSLFRSFSSTSLFWHWSGPIKRLKHCHVMKERLGSLSSLITVAVKLHPGLNLGRQQQYTDTVCALVLNTCFGILDTKAKQKLWVAALWGEKSLKKLMKFKLTIKMKKIK